MNNTFIVTLEEDGEDLILPLPKELLENLKWSIGDTLEWIDQGNGCWSLRKKS